MKTIHLNLTLAAASAITLAACDQPVDHWTAEQDTAICTDRNGTRVPDAQCQTHHVGSVGTAFLWYYLGRNSVVPYYGERVAGGSFTRTAGATYFHAPVRTAMTRSAAVARGGFGSSARSFGSFGE
ncbi:hypothetical protein [Sphingomonas crusticola]|uniref:hypothetical protein n=1 Tax=Sphingomonas crusticola TaxID=1697973 RepID=UPI000E26C7D7|nr:hypothetical protein [Sphingomonas crusticola]